MDRAETIAKIVQQMEIAGRHLGRLHSEERGQSGIPTRAQFGVLITIATEGGGSTTQIAERFGMSPSAVTQLVDALVKDGLVERHNDPADRRKTEITLTEAGRQSLEKAKATHRASLASLFEVLDDSELDQLCKIHAKITNHLNSRQ